MSNRLKQIKSTEKKHVRQGTERHFAMFLIRVMTAYIIPVHA